MVAIEFAGAASAFAMVGLGKIGEFKINRESFGDLVRPREIHFRDHLLDLHHRIRRHQIAGYHVTCYQVNRGRGGGASSDLLAMLDQQLPELLNRVKQFTAALLDQHLPEKRAQRSDIPPQGIILGGILRPCREFGETGILVFGLPQQFGLAHEAG